MKQWMIIGAVVAVIAALLIVATGMGQQPTNPFEDENLGDCSCRVFIEDANGQLLYADVPLTALTFSEASMLSFGQGVREVTFKPLASFTSTTSQLAFSSNYKVYAEVSFKVTGGSSTSSVTASFQGTSGLTQSSSAAPNHERSGNILITPNAQPVVSWTKSGIVSGTAYTMSQNGAVDGDNDKWSQYIPMPAGAPLTKLTGDTIDGAQLGVTLTVKSGTETQSATADLLIKVTSWGSTASSSSLTVTITGMSGKAA